MTDDSSTDAPTQDWTGGRAGGRAGVHPVSSVHLVMGTVFLALAAVWALITAGTVSGDDVRWVLPVPFVLGGAVGLVALAVAARRQPGGGQ